VGPMVQSGDEDAGGPSWLKPLLRTVFFVPCKIHVDSSKSEFLDSRFAIYNPVDCCSLSSQLGGMKTDPEITFNLRPKPGRDSLYGLESDTSSSPRKLRKTSSAFSRRIEVPIPHLEDDATATSRSISPGTPPIVSYRTSKRKGIPHRAPF
ncbi:hypothetical protein BHE74_00040979, partial [Ensete ventricosum]